MKAQIAMLSVAALMMWGLKRHYADAPVDQLRWILRPTATVVTGLTGARFEAQPGEGYISRQRCFLIEKACAGINFMIAAFGMVVWVVRRRVESWRTAAGFIAVSLAASYAATVGVNAVRIAVAVWLIANPFEASWMTAAQLHRTEGIAFYFGGLVLLHELARRFDGSAPPTAAV